MDECKEQEIGNPVIILSSVSFAVDSADLLLCPVIVAVVDPLLLLLCLSYTFCLLREIALVVDTQNGPPIKLRESDETLNGKL